MTNEVTLQGCKAVEQKPILWTTSREEALRRTRGLTNIAGPCGLACRWAAERRRGLAAPMGSDPTLAFASFHPAAQWLRRPRLRSEQVVAVTSAARLICRALWRRRCSVGTRTAVLLRGVINSDAAASMIAHGRVPGVRGRSFSAPAVYGSPVEVGQELPVLSCRSG